MLHEPCRASRLEGVATCGARDPLLLRLVALRADGLVKLKDVLVLDVDIGLAELQQLGQETSCVPCASMRCLSRASMRAATALLAMVTYRCILYVTTNKPAGGKIIHNKTLSGGPCIRFNTVLFLYLFWITYHVLCNPGCTHFRSKVMPKPPLCTHFRSPNASSVLTSIMSTSA